MGATQRQQDQPECPLFSRYAQGVGELALRALDPDADAAVIQPWVNTEHARFWGMQGASVERVAESYHEIVSAAHSSAYLGLHDGAPAFVLEVYDPAGEPAGECYEPADGDRGMHLLIAPPERPIHQFTWHVFITAMDFIFQDPSVQRLVVEPDVRNERIHFMNERAGFVYHRTIELPEKTAWLATCTRDQYQKARQEGANS